MAIYLLQCRDGASAGKVPRWSQMRRAIRIAYFVQPKLMIRQFKDEQYNRDEHAEPVKISCNIVSADYGETTVITLWLQLCASMPQLEGVRAIMMY